MPPPESIVCVCSLSLEYAALISKPQASVSVGLPHPHLSNCSIITFNIKAAGCGHHPLLRTTELLQPGHRSCQSPWPVSSGKTCICLPSWGRRGEGLPQNATDSQCSYPESSRFFKINHFSDCSDVGSYPEHLNGCAYLSLCSCSLGRGEPTSLLDHGSAFGDFFWNLWFISFSPQN